MAGTRRKHGSRSEPRALLPLVVAVLTCCASVVFGVAPAAVAAPRTAVEPLDACTPAEGAVVAVDFGRFQGPVQRGCSTGAKTGYELLQQGGFTTAGTDHDGPGFICRIGHPSVAAGKQHPTAEQEKCQHTPPASAYWSYWVTGAADKDWRVRPRSPRAASTPRRSPCWACSPR
ncbi:hypothetical protein ACWEV4_01190 [Streptomyces sp. NPDC003860]